MLAAIALHETAKRRIEAKSAYVLMDDSPQLAPSLDRSIHSELLDSFHGAIEGDPCHDLGIGEALPIAAHFPNAIVRFLPDGFQMIEQSALQLPAVGIG